MIDKATVSGGDEPVVVTLAMKDARTEFELPASPTRQSVALQIEENVSGTGDVLPARGIVLHVTTPGLTFNPPASMRQSVSPPPANQRYVAISMPSAGSAWIVGLSARRGTFRDPQQSIAPTSGTEVWEIDVTGSGLWALGLVRDARLDGGALDAGDRGMDREAGVSISADGGGARAELDGAAFRWDAGTRADVPTDGAPIDAADEAPPDVRNFAPDLRTRIDTAAGTESDARLPSGDGRGPVAASDAPQSSPDTGAEVLLSLTPPSVPPTTVGGAGVSPVPVAFTGPLTDLTCTVSDPTFVVQMGTCSRTYGAAGSCALDLTFAPTSAGTAKGSLTCTAVGISAATVPLVGTAVVLQLTVSPTSLDFGSVGTGTSSAATSISVHNSGTVATGELSVALDGTSAAAFSFTSTCAAGLAAGATCVVTVSFRPEVAGSAAATLTVTDGQTTCTVALGGVGTAAESQLTASPSSVSFGTLLVNTTSAPASITIRNGGAATTGTLGFTITGPGAAAFVPTSACPSPLAAGDVCTATVSFKPTTTGSATAILTVTDGNLTATVPLSGAGAGASALHIVISPENLDFGSIVTGTTSVASTISIRNSGTATTGRFVLSVSGASASSFAFTSGCTSPLAPGETCTAAVTFAPTATGSAAAILTATEGNAIATVSLTGMGAPATTPRLTISPSSFDFGAIKLRMTSAPAVFTVTNSGNATTESVVITITGASASSFATTSYCSSSLAPGSTCTVSVTFAPTAVGSSAATLTVIGGTATATASLTGTGISPARLTASPASVSFGVVVVGSASSPTGITITNSGGVATGSLTFSRTGSAASSFPATTVCGEALGPGESCVVAVTFAPLNTGALSATATVSDGSVSASVPLSGTSVSAARLTVSPPSADLGSVAVGSSSAATTITVTNAGAVTTGRISVSLSGAAAVSFTTVAETCTGASLAPASSCMVVVKFFPSAVGAAAASLTAADSSVSATASLTGTGIPATLP